MKKNIKVFISGMFFMGIIMGIGFYIYYIKIQKELLTANIPKIVYGQNGYKYLEYKENRKEIEKIKKLINKNNNSYLMESSIGNYYNISKNSFLTFDTNIFNTKNKNFKIINQAEIIFTGFSDEKENQNYSNRCFVENELKKYIKNDFTILDIISQKNLTGEHYGWKIDFDGEIPYNDLKKMKYLKNINNLYYKDIGNYYTSNGKFIGID